MIRTEKRLIESARHAPAGFPDMIRSPFRSAARAISALVLVQVTLTPQALAAQSKEQETGPLVEEVAYLSANAALGGLIVGLLRVLRAESFREGFIHGALGGAVAYGGRRVAVEHFRGAGLLGRQISAVGSAIARNASESRPALSRVTFPVGPLLLRYDRAEHPTLSARIDAFTTVVVIAAIWDDRIDFDLDASLSAGAPVFRAPRHLIRTDGGAQALGVATGGMILLAADAEARSRRRVLPHERVHVLQHDYLQEMIGDPLEIWLLGHVPTGDTVSRLMRPGLVVPGVYLTLTNLFDLRTENRPWEMEADFLDGR